MEELNAIYERMRTIFSEEAGFVPNDGCDAMVRLYALASEVQALLAQADWVLNQSFPQTAAGRYLDYHAETRALTRLPAAKATGVLRFSAPSAAVTDYEIDAGSVAMTSGGVRFETTEKATLAKGKNYVDVPAIAVEAGANGNAIAGAIHLMSVYPVGITQCENPEAFSGGSDEALLNGVMTLCQWVQRHGVQLPALEIEDAPDLAARAYYLDCSRGRVPTLATLKRYAELRDLFLPMEPADIALLLEEGKQEQMPLLYRLLPKELAAEVFVELESDSQEMLINGFSNTELKEVLDELYLDDAVDIVEEMPASVVIRILDKATPEMRKSINEILQYPEDSAGSIMNMEFLSLKKDMTVEDAFKRIRRIGGELETINILYVTDPTRHLLGVLSVRDLLLAEEDDLIEEIMDPNVVSVNTMDDKEDVAQALSKYDFLAMPVVDKEERLVGIVTVDDAMDVIEEETTEDFEKMAAMLPSDKPYLKSGIFATWKARLPWLMILMLSATFTGMILNHYESALAACLVLNSYIPMLSGTGGNSGTQASVAVIRALSLDEVDFSDILRVLWKELRVSLLCGVCLAGANFVKMQLVDRLLLGNAAVTPTVCLVVCLTILFVVVFAKCVGCSLPLLAEKIGLDPAVMASPFISTIVDATSLLIYFRFASWLLL